MSRSSIDVRPRISIRSQSAVVSKKKPSESLGAQRTISSARPALHPTKTGKTHPAIQSIRRGEGHTDLALILICSTKVLQPDLIINTSTLWI